MMFAAREPKDKDGYKIDLKMFLPANPNKPKIFEFKRQQVEAGEKTEDSLIRLDNSMQIDSTQPGCLQIQVRIVSYDNCESVRVPATTTARTLLQLVCVRHFGKYGGKTG